MKTLTRKPIQKTAEEVHQYLVDYYIKEKMYPTLDEIAQFFSKGRARPFTNEWARYVLRYLADQKKIKIEPRKRRGISLI